MTTRVAILASGDRKSGGGGSTMERFIRDTQSGVLNAEVVLVVCNNPLGTVAVYDRVKQLNDEFGLAIEVLTINNRTHPDGAQPRGQTLSESAAILQALEERRVDFVMCLGYMKQLNGALIKKLGWKPAYKKLDPAHNGIYLASIANTHPGILPATTDTYGLGTSKRVLELGLSHTAVTLHVVASGIDKGPVIAENLVPVLPGMSAEDVFTAVQKKEKATLGREMNDYFKKRWDYLKKTS